MDQEVVLNSIKAAGFGNACDWMIYKHDVYGEQFQQEGVNDDLLEC